MNLPNKPSALICGCLTYDTLMIVDEKLKNRLFEQDRNTEVYFSVPDLRRQFGGSAGNIAYNLQQLNVEALPMATVGTDFPSYSDWLDSQNIKRHFIQEISHGYTAQTFIIIDVDDNRMIAFHAGAMSFSHHNRISRQPNTKIAVIAADNAEGMTLHALQCVEEGIPFIFNPSYTIRQFDGDDLLKFIEQATWIMVNQQEWQLMSQRTGLSAAQIARRVQALIITQEAEGATIYAQETRYQIPNAIPKAVNDKMGCGDAFCAGLVYGLIKDIDWETTGRVATLMGTIKVEHHGTQNHHFNFDLFKMRFKKNFGYALMI